MSHWISWIVLVPVCCALGWPRPLVLEGPAPSSGVPALGTLCWAPDELTVDQARHLEVSGAHGRRAAMAVPVMLHPNGSVRLGRLLTTVLRGETSLQLTRRNEVASDESSPFELPHARVSFLGDAVLPVFRSREDAPLLAGDGAPAIEVLDGRLTPRLVTQGSGRWVFRTSAAARFKNEMSLQCGDGVLHLAFFSTVFAGCDLVDICMLFVAEGRLRTQGVRFELVLEPPITTLAQGRPLAVGRDGGGDRIVFAADALGAATLQIGERPPDAFAVESLAVELRGRRGLARLTIPDFARLGPRRVEVTPAGRLVFDMLAAPRSWSDGDSLRADFSLSVVPCASASGSPAPAAAVCARPRLGERGVGLEREPLFACRAASAAKAGERELTEAALALLADEAARTVGVFDHGDFRLASGQFSNLEFDPLLGLSIDFVRRGRCASLELAGALARHWSAYDIIRGNFDLELSGMPWQHGDDHASQRFELGHVFLAGPLRAHMLLDDPILDEVVAEMLERLPEVCDDERLFRNERSLGWGLAALSDLALVTGAPGVWARLAAMLERLETRQAPEGYFRFDTVVREEERCWQANLWVTALTTFEALDQACSLTHDERALRMLMKLIEFFDREVTTYPSFTAPNRVFFRTRDGKRQGSSGRLRGADLALVAALFDRAGTRRQDAALRRKADALWARVELEDLGPAPGPQLAKLLRALAFRRG